jgi:hypothetical protein
MLGSGKPSTGVAGPPSQSRLHAGGLAVDCRKHGSLPRRGQHDVEILREHLLDDRCRLTGLGLLNVDLFLEQEIFDVLDPKRRHFRNHVKDLRSSAL